MRCSFLRAGLLAAFVSITSDARADWLLSPFIGTTFAGESTSSFIPFASAQEAVGAKHWLFGGSAGWLSDQVLGVEADFAFVPGIFQNDDPFNLVLASSALTVSGNVIVAVPLTVTRESLRPYVIGGLGLLHATAEDLECLLLCEPLDELALQLGGGAIGMVSDRAGVRFDLRHARTLRREDTLTGDRRAKLSFWRATVGVVIRY